MYRRLHWYFTLVLVLSSHPTLKVRLPSKVVCTDPRDENRGVGVSVVTTWRLTVWTSRNGVPKEDKGFEWKRVHSPSGPPRSFNCKLGGGVWRSWLLTTLNYIFMGSREWEVPSYWDTTLYVTEGLWGVTQFEVSRVVIVSTQTITLKMIDGKEGSKDEGEVRRILVENLMWVNLETESRGKPLWIWLCCSIHISGPLLFVLPLLFTVLHKQLPPCLLSSTLVPLTSSSDPCWDSPEDMFSPLRPKQTSRQW